jgi:hypothetical protein
MTGVSVAGGRRPETALEVVAEDAADGALEDAALRREALVGGAHVVAYLCRIALQLQNSSSLPSTKTMCHGEGSAMFGADHSFLPVPYNHSQFYLSLVCVSYYWSLLSGCRKQFYDTMTNMDK